MDPDELTDSHLRGFRQIADWLTGLIQRITRRIRNT